MANDTQDSAMVGKKKQAKKVRRRTRGSGCLYQRGRVWWMSASTDYGSFRESTGKETKGEAQEVLTRKLAQLQAGTGAAGSHKTTVADLAADVVRDYSINGKKSLRDVNHRWKLHLEPFFGKLRAAQVTPDLVERYKDLRIKEGAENGTINRELAVLRRGFKLGLRLGKVYRVPQFAMLAESKPRSGFLDEKQYKQLSEACAKRAPWLLAFFEVAAQLSNRRAELLNLKVRHIDFLAGDIRFEDTKNGETRTVPMTPSVRELMQMCCQGKESDAFVFTWPDGRRVKDFRATWKAACADAGVPGLKVHDLRRTGIRNMIRRGVPENIAMRFSGHKTVSVFRRYNIISDADLRNAARQIEAGRSRQFTDTAQSVSRAEGTTVN